VKHRFRCRHLVSWIETRPRTRTTPSSSSLAEVTQALRDVVDPDRARDRQAHSLPNEPALIAQGTCRSGSAPTWVGPRAAIAGLLELATTTERLRLEYSLP